MRETDADRLLSLAEECLKEAEKALRFEIVAGKPVRGERPVRARTISCREECVDDNVGIERRFKGFFK